MKTLAVTRHAGISLRNILFATDFSEVSHAALPYAAAIARRYDSQLHIAHITSPASYIIPSQPCDPFTLDSIHEALRERTSVSGCMIIVTFDFFPS